MRPKLLSLLTFFFVLVLPPPLPRRRASPSSSATATTRPSPSSKIRYPTPRRSPACSRPMATRSSSTTTSRAPTSSTRSRVQASRGPVDGRPHLLRRPRHGARRQERHRPDRHGGELRQPAGAPLGRGGEAVRGPRSAPEQVVLFDACRNNPFPQCPKRSAVSGSGFRGFTRIATPSRALLIANATGSGQLAADGDPGSSLALRQGAPDAPAGEPERAHAQPARRYLARGLPGLQRRPGARDHHPWRLADHLPRRGWLRRRRRAAGRRRPGQRRHGRRSPHAPCQARLSSCRPQRRRPGPGRRDPQVPGERRPPPDGQVSATLVAVLRASTRVAALGSRPEPARSCRPPRPSTPSARPSGTAPTIVRTWSPSRRAAS